MYMRVSPVVSRCGVVDCDCQRGGGHAEEADCAKAAASSSRATGCRPSGGSSGAPAGCAAAEGSGAVSLQQQKMCEGCGEKRAAYGLSDEGRQSGMKKQQWCAGCAVPGR